MIERERTEKGTFIPSHGRYGTKLYKCWGDMKQRCNNPNDGAYERYGGKGIKVCAEWESFDGFQSWAMQNGYKDGLTIDRIDNSKGYSPDNCRWATRAEQNRNKRTNVKITIDGETKCMAEWAKVYGIDERLVRWRIKQGWPLERVFEAKNHTIGGRFSQYQSITFNGETRTAIEWAEKTGTNIITLVRRINRGCAGEELFSKTRVDVKKVETEL